MKVDDIQIIIGVSIVCHVMVSAWLPSTNSIDACNTQYWIPSFISSGNFSVLALRTGGMRMRTYVLNDISV